MVGDLEDEHCAKPWEDRAEEEEGGEDEEDEGEEVRFSMTELTTPTQGSALLALCPRLTALASTASSI